MECFLEASGKKNRSIYEKSGYKVAEEFMPEFNGSSPKETALFMIRAPV